MINMSLVACMLCVMIGPLAAQNVLRYNKNLHFVQTTANVEIKHVDSLKILLVNFEKYEKEVFKISLKNNPQLIELQLINPPQDAIEMVSALELKALTHFFVVDYAGTDLRLGKFPNINHLQLESKHLENLDMQNAQLDSLYILHVDAPNLKQWATDSLMPTLSLIYLKAPQLSVFPIKNMPNLYQFDYSCSFNEIPVSWCRCENLRHISFSNYKVVPVDRCFRKKIKNAHYSHLSIIDGIEGPEVVKILSKDRRKSDR